MTSLYATIAPRFTQDLLTPELKVGYHDEGGSWPFVAASLSQRLPLRCIEWKNLVGATKFIDKLPLSFVAQSELELDSAVLPLVCVYLVKCEDMDHYRASVKARLGAWVERMNAAKVEWMVLYVPLGTRAKGRGASSSTSVYKKIFDKIRADFAHKRPSVSAAGIMLGAGASLTGANSNSSSSSMGGSGGSSSNTSNSGSASERICKIEIFEGNSIAGGGAPGQHQQHESQWSELLLRLRHCIMDAFQVKCYQYEEEVRVLDAKRNANAAGWDFGAFFLAKERLALMYQQTYLLDDAIRHLDELDAIFMNLSASEKRSFQDESKLSFHADDAIFTTAPLAVDLPATQQLIAKNRVSTLVIQLHCFCRQMRTLYLMGSFPQLLQRATAFVASFFESLRQLSLSSSESSGIKRHQPYQWAVAACLEVAYACELSWSGHDYQVSSASVPSQVTQAISPELMARNLGDILYLARRMLTAFARSLGTNVGTIRSASDTQVDTDVDTLVSENPSSAWYEWLQTLFASHHLGERYERCVWEMSHLASLHFSRAGRHRFAVFLGGECARYHFRHREFESASRLFRSHARQCEEDKWWNLVGDCVRRICSSELELGRAAEAVAVCFSMLTGVTQEARVEIGRDYLEKMMHTLVQSLDHQKDSTTKLRMGELIKPSTVEVETMQTAGSDLDYGDVRVKLCITNCFPAGIHIEELRVRFTKRIVVASRSGQYDSVELRATPRKKRSSSITSTQSELPRLHSLVLEDESPSSAVDIKASDSTGQAMGVATALCDSELVDIDITTVSDDDELQSSIENAEANDESELILQEGNVFLHEKASVDLVFLHTDLGVGDYVCSGVDCILAGNLFSLLAPSELEKVAFEIPRRESTLRIAIDGPPLLTPLSTEQICITVQAQSDTVTDGVLEITCPVPGSGLEDEPGLLQFLEAEVEPSSTTTAFKAQAKFESLDGSDKLVLSIPAMSPGAALVYKVWLRVGEPVDLEVGSVSLTTVSASLRYQHVTQTDTSVALRRTEAAFQVLRPLTERIRLKRVDSRIFAAISLACNAECGLLLRDYRLELSSHSSAAGIGDELANNNVGSLIVLQDPNARLRNSRLRPRETVHLAFVLQCENDANLPQEARLALDLDYDATVSATGDADDVVQQQQQQSAASQCWPSTLAVRIPLDGVRGAYYRIDVEPKLKSKGQEASYEFAAGEEIIFHVLVKEFRPKRVVAGAQDQQQPEADETQDEEKLDVVLCLDESSERDWILLGKQHERFQFQSPSGDESNKSSSSIVDSHVTRAFATQKRFISTRVGRLRFPNFHLRVHGSPQQQQERIPSERVLYPQSTMQVIVT